MVEAKETMTVPQKSPKTAPPTSVITAAPGRDKPVTTTAVRYFIAYTANSQSGVPGLGGFGVFSSPIGQEVGGGSGDLNGDGAVDIRDATLSLGIAVGARTATGDQMKSGDVNGDGKLDLRDTTLILRKAAGA